MEKQKLITEIMTLAFLVHEKTDYCVWIDFSGHVDSIDIRLAESKEHWQNKVCESQFYTKFKEYYDIDDPMAYLKSRADVLRSILQTNEIPYHDLVEHNENVRTYTF